VAGREPTAERKLATLIAYLQQHCVYTLKAPATPHGEDATDYFLFDSQRGYCDLFASSLAVMARAVGIPARLVEGYAYGAPISAEAAGPRPAGRMVGRPGWGAAAPAASPLLSPPPPSAAAYQLRESDAHIWVEAYLQPWGWVTADATPAGKESPVPPLRRSLLHARFFWQDHPLLSLLVAAGALALVFLVRVWARRIRLRLPGRAAPPADASAAVVRTYSQLLALLRRAGQLRRPSQTPLEFLAVLGQPRTELPAAAAAGRGLLRPPRGSRLGHLRQARSRPDTLAAALPAIASLTDLFLLARYGPAPLSDDRAREAYQHLQQIRRALRGDRTRAAAL
jgi:hypothetical protein